MSKKSADRILKNEIDNLPEPIRGVVKSLNAKIEVLEKELERIAFEEKMKPVG